MGVMLVRISERSKMLFERLDGMAAESWVSPLKHAALWGFFFCNLVLQLAGSAAKPEADDSF